MTNHQTTMTTDAQSATVVLKDSARSYYLVSQETMEQGRVPEEHKAALEEQLAAMPAHASAGEDVQGYIAPFVAGVLAGAGATLFGFTIGAGLAGDDLGPLIQEMSDWAGGQIR